MPDVVTILENNRVITEVSGADVAAQIAIAASAENADRAEQAYQDILEVASGAPDAPSILNKVDKAANGSDFADLGQFRANIGLFDTRAAAAAATIAAEIDSIKTAGFAASGDGGGATYDRWVAGMASLPVGGEGVWWFEAADGSRWQIAEAPQHMAAAFGALGGAAIDARPIINEAFLAPMVREINLGALTHYISLPGLRPASGKNLVGINRAVSWLRVIPVTGPSTGQNYAVGRINHDGGLCRDYSIDCQRSHFGIGMHGQPHGHAIYAKAGGTCRNVNVVRVDVHNCYGYAHYTTTGPATDGLLVEDTRREDCRAFNFNVGFEETGTVNRHVNVRPVAIAAPQDGGVLLSCEALFHQYGAVQDVVNVEPYGRGTTQSAISIFNVENQDIEKIHYINPDIDVTGDFGLYVEGRNAAGTANPADGTINKIKDVQVFGGRIRASLAGGVLRGAQTTVKIHGTEIIGRDGVGLELSQNVNVTFYAPDIESNRPVGGSTSAVGIAINGPPNAKWHGGGRIAANGPAGSFATDLLSIKFFGSPELVPAMPVSSPITKQYRIPQSSWIDGGTGLQYAELDLTRFRPTGGKGEALMYVSAILEFPFPGPPLDYSLSVLHISGNLVIRVYIKSATVLTNYVLKAQVTEYPA